MYWKHNNKIFVESDVYISPGTGNCVEEPMMIF